MKQWVLALTVLCICSCGNVRPGYHTGSAYILQPGLEMYGWKCYESLYHVALEGYFQSSIAGRTEYIYEDFQLTFPAGFMTNHVYSLRTPGVNLWFARGGQAGQVESTNAVGTFVILETNTAGIKIRLDAEFTQFTNKDDGGFMELPESVRRQGVITAGKSFVFY